MAAISKEKIELFERTPINKALITLAVPTIISQLVNLIYSLADTFYVGRTGNPYMIAGVSLAYSIYALIIPFANLFGVGGGSLIARMMGKGQAENAKVISVFSYWCSAFFAFIFSILILLFMEPLLRLLGGSEQTMDYAKEYTLLVVVFGAIPSIVSLTSAHLLRNTGYAKQASIGLSGGSILNIILDPLFMFVLFPTGKEVYAAALATLLSNVLSCAYLTYKLISLSNCTPLSIQPSRLKEIQKKEIKQVFSVGIPSSILPGLFDVANFVLYSLMSAYGDYQLAAIGIVLKAERLPNAIGLGISQGMLPLVAYNYSSGNRERMQSAVKNARIIGIALSFLCIALYHAFAPQLCGIFLSTSADAVAATATLAYTIKFLRIRSLASPVQFLNYHTSYCMQSIGDGPGTMAHACIRILGIYIPLMFLLNLFGQNFLAAGSPISEIFGALIALLLLNHWLKNH